MSIFLTLSELIPDPPHFPTHPTSCSFSLSQKENNRKKEQKMKVKTDKHAEKKSLRQKYQNKTKGTHTRTHKSFCIISTPWDLPRSVVNIPTETPLEKADFHFPSRHQL